MKSIVRRDTGESYDEYLKRLAEAEGVNAKDAAALRRMDRKRKKKTSNEDWESPSDGDAEITKLKDGRTALAYKAENAVDMETGAIVAVTTHGGAAADTATVEGTVIEAGAAVAELVTAEPPEGKYQVHPGGVEEVVADKGYHSNEVVSWIERTGGTDVHRGTGSEKAQLGRQAGRKGSGVWEPAAHPGRARQADAAATG
jgi:transposase